MKHRHVCGADLESASRNGGCASQDIEEMRKTTGQPDGVNIVLETGGAKSWKSNIIGGSGVTKITAGELGRYHITNNKVIKDGALADANMGEASTLQNFIEWGIENYPAQKYGLFMWNHGGALSGCCFDENHDDDSLTADELTQAVTAARNNKNITNKFEFIAYDACLMAVQDVAEYNASNFNYMLSSQESEYSGGYVYNEWLPTLYDNPSSVSTVTLLSTIGSTFLDYFNSKGYYDQTQSVYDLSKMSAYKTAFESFASDLDAILGDDESKALTLVNTIYPAQKYGQDSDNGETIYPFDIFDVNSALAKITANSTFSSLSSKAQVVRTALSQLVVYEDHGSSITGCGICLYCPISLYSLPYDYNYNGYVGPTSNFTNWKEVANKAFWASYDDYVANNS